MTLSFLLICYCSFKRLTSVHVYSCSKVGVDFEWQLACDSIAIGITKSHRIYTVISYKSFCTVHHHTPHAF